MSKDFYTVGWQKFNIKDFFRIEYGNKFDKCNMIESTDSTIAFVTRTATNNGVGTYVDVVEGVKPYPKGCLTVALGGSLGSTFLQPSPFYTAQNVAVLIPRDDLDVKMTSNHKLFFATLIKKESEIRYVAFGRELNTHINKDFFVKLPIKTNGSVDWDEIDRIMSLCEIQEKLLPSNGDVIPDLNIQNWKYFEINSIFPKQQRERGKIHSIESLPDGEDYFYIGAKKKENGVMSRCGYDAELISKGNCIVFICNGQGSVGYSLYMDKDFMASGDLLLAYNENLNKYNGLFLVTILDKERFKYSFGRKYGKYIPKMKLLLPAKGNQPDWQFMEDYIKCLPYSANL